MVRFFAAMLLSLWAEFPTRMNQNFEMVAKTFKGLEGVLAEELRQLGALNVQPGNRMVSFEGDKAMLYRANFACRTALRILKPIYKFIARDSDALYEMVKEYDWGSILDPSKTFAIDTVSYSDEFTHSRFVTYRVKDAIADWFTDRLGAGNRPGVRLQDADVMINVHISGDRVTLSLDSSGESLHKRGWREAQTEAPINEVLAAGILLMSGWRGDTPLVDPMCGSGTFLIEGAMIAAGIAPGIYRRGYAFEQWPDFEPQLLEALYDDDTQERTPPCPIMGADLSPKAAAIAVANVKRAGLSKYIGVEVKPLSAWQPGDAPAGGVVVTNPPYGERIQQENMDSLYELLGSKLKTVFTGYHAWIIAYRTEHFNAIHLSPSRRVELLNGSLECELREYVMFDGDYKSYVAQGGRLHHGDEEPRRPAAPRRLTDGEWQRNAARGGHGGHKAVDRKSRDWKSKDPKSGDKGFGDRKFGDKKFGDKKPFDRKPFDKKFDRKPFDKKFDRKSLENKDFDRKPRQEEVESENPLYKRRNPLALNILRGKKPTLPPDDAPLMRPRRGWKKK